MSVKDVIRASQAAREGRAYTVEDARVFPLPGGKTTMRGSYIDCEVGASGELLATFEEEGQDEAVTLAVIGADGSRETISIMKSDLGSAIDVLCHTRELLTLGSGATADDG